MRKICFILCLTFAFVIQTFAQQQDDMRKTVDYLASQQLGGRYPGSTGDTLASEFITAKLRGLKLKPIVDKQYIHEGLEHSLPQRHWKLIPQNEEAIEIGKGLIEAVHTL